MKRKHAVNMFYTKCSKYFSLKYRRKGKYCSF